MTRITNVIFYANSPYKKFNNYRPLPKFKVLLPPILRDSVSGKAGVTKVAPCREELSLMINCWKKTEFEAKKCSNEISIFQTCMDDYYAKKTAGQLETGRKLPAKKINQLLKRYPQPVPTIKAKF